MKTYQFFYLDTVKGIKWRVDGETTDLTEAMLNDRQKAEVEALWDIVEKVNMFIIYDHVRDWDTGKPV